MIWVTQGTCYIRHQRTGFHGARVNFFPEVKVCWVLFRFVGDFGQHNGFSSIQSSVNSWQTTAPAGVCMHAGVPAGRRLNRSTMADNRTVFLVNTFIAHTVLLLNNFSAFCEEQLANVHLRILRLEATTALLESKLDSVTRLRGEAGRVSEEDIQTPSES